MDWKDAKQGKDITLLENLEQDGFQEVTLNPPRPGWIWRLILKLGVIFTLVLFSACVSTGPKAITDQSLLSQIKVDKSTEAEVTELLGLPETVSHPQNEIVWKYFYRTNLPSIPSYIPIVKVFRSDLNQETQILAVTFNKEGIVKGLQCQKVFSREDSPGPY